MYVDLRQDALDSTNIDILKILTWDARTPYNSIASALDLSANTVKNRISRIPTNKAIEGLLALEKWSMV